MRIEYTPYQLKPLPHLAHSKVLSQIQGLLLRIFFTPEQWGYACLQPWPQLGDFTLKEYFQFLIEQRWIGILPAVLENARKDCHARAAGASLFHELPKEFNPKNHYNIMDIANHHFQPVDWKDVTHLKIKMGRNFLKEKKFFENNAQWLKHFYLRLDYNFSTPQSQEERDFVLWILEKFNVDFFEDFSLFKSDFKNNNFFITPKKSAIDFQKNKADLSKYDILIQKPSLEEQIPENLIEKKRIIFTSGLDHPLGQTHAWHAAWDFYAKHPGKIEVCGLVTHVHFEKNEYSERMQMNGMSLVTDTEKVATGFDDLLEKEKWERCFSDSVT